MCARRWISNGTAEGVVKISRKDTEKSAPIRLAAGFDSGKINWVAKWPRRPEKRIQDVNPRGTHSGNFMAMQNPGIMCFNLLISLEF
jgi:hypothetical protein